MYTRWPVILVAAMLSGCVSSKVQQGGTPGAARAASGIYLAPFVNGTGNGDAGSAVTEIAATSMMAHGLPVIQSEGLRAQANELIDKGQQHQMMEIARASGASHALFGTVHEYRFKSDLDGAPTVGMTTRLVDVANGSTVWQGTTSKSGYYYGSLSKTAQSAIDNLVSQMAGRGRTKSSRRKSEEIVQNPYASNYGETGYSASAPSASFTQPTASYAYPDATAGAAGLPSNLSYQQAPPVIPGYSANANYQTPQYDYKTPTYSGNASNSHYGRGGNWWSQVFGNEPKSYRGKPTASRGGMPETEPFRWTKRLKSDAGLEYEQIARRGSSTSSPWPVASVPAQPYAAPAVSYEAPPVTYAPPAVNYTTPTVSAPPTQATTGQWVPSTSHTAPKTTFAAPVVTATPPNFAASAPNYSANANSTWTANSTSAPSRPATANTAGASSQPTSRWTPSNY